MDFETLAGIYTYVMDHHSGQWSRLYRLMPRINFHAPSRVYLAIQGNHHLKNTRAISDATWAEWERSRQVYRKLKRRKAE